MNAILHRLRIDIGRRTIGELAQEREAAVAEIERLLMKLGEVGVPKVGQVRRPLAEKRGHDIGRVPWGERKLLRLKEVCEIIGLSRSTIYKRLAEGSFPRPVRLSERATRWRPAEIEDWLQRQR